VVFGRIPFLDKADIREKEPDFDLPVASTHPSDKSDKISAELRECL